MFLPRLMYLSQSLDENWISQHDDVLRWHLGEQLETDCDHHLLNLLYPFCLRHLILYKSHQFAGLNSRLHTISDCPWHLWKQGAKRRCCCLSWLDHVRWPKSDIDSRPAEPWILPPVMCERIVWVAWRKLSFEDSGLHCWAREEFKELDFCVYIYIYDNIRITGIGFHTYKTFMHVYMDIDVNIYIYYAKNWCMQYLYSYLYVFFFLNIFYLYLHFYLCIHLQIQYKYMWHVTDDIWYMTYAKYVDIDGHRRRHKPVPLHIPAHISEYLYIYIFTFAYAFASACAFTCTHIYTYACTYTCPYACTSTYIQYIYTYRYVSIYIYIDMWWYVYVCMCVYI